MVNIDHTLKDHPIVCGSCIKCCRGHAGVLLYPEHGDDPNNYEGNVEMLNGRSILKTRPNNDCVYLDLKHGCTIYDQRPKLCRMFDCRSEYITWVALPREERRKMMKSGKLNADTHKEGRLQLKKTLGGKKQPMAAE